MLKSLEGLNQVKNALIRQNEIISNNLANIGTVGFKKDAVAFHQILDEKSNPQLIPVIKTDSNNGSFQQTNNALDLSVQGDGYFSVQTPQGARYTRNGSFQLSEKGLLTDHFGNPVLSDKGPVAITPELQTGEISVGSDGQISIGETSFGRLLVTNFKEGTAMNKVGQNLFEVPNAEVVPGSYQVQQGTLELSTVNSVQEMVEMMDTLRLFETSQGATHLQDEALGKAISELA